MIKSLYEILKTNEYSVIIPKIQRDYAQGRKGEEDIRRDFLGEIKHYLQSGNKLKLDFVFGSKDEEKKQFVPIDGQQRITTLWLLHWYLAVKTNKIANHDVCQWLQRFTYETRNSSGEFCKKICSEFQKASEKDDRKVLSGKIDQYPSLADYIQNQTWFFAEYKHDPTIDAMLRTISGDIEYIHILIDRANKIKDKIRKVVDYKNDPDLFSLYELIGDNIWEYVDLDDVNGIPKTADLIRRQSWFSKTKSPIDLSNKKIYKILNQLDAEKYFGNDCLEGVFYKCDYEELWKKLTTDNLIIFEEIDVGGKQLPDRDDLYVKMNSRGKQLSNFENFKSDFISWLRENKNPNADKICMAIDKEWTDVILRVVLKNYEDLDKLNEFEGVLDDVFFAFINRFVFYKFYRKSKRKNEAGSDNFDKNLNVLYFQGKKTNDDKEGTDLNIRYSRFEYYKEILTNRDAKELNEIFMFLENNRGFLGEHEKAGDLKELFDKYQVKNISFIPHYSIDKEQKVFLQNTTYRSRVYFQAIRAFIEACGSSQYDKSKLEHWVRICRNIIENTEISNVKQMVTCCNLIDWFAAKLIANKCDIYSALYKYKNKLDELKPPAQQDQVKEEVVKIIAILDQKDIENDLIDAENHAFFRGSIRFLYSDDIGKEDWSNFTTKFENAKNIWFNVSANISTEDGNTDEDEGDAGIDKNANKVCDKTIINFLHCFKSFDDLFISIDGTKRYVHLFTNIGYHHRKHCWKKDILLEPNLLPQVNKLLMAKSDIGFESSVDPDYKDFVEGNGPQKLYEMNDSYKICLIEYGKKYAFHKDRLWYDYLIVEPERKAKCEFLMKNRKITVTNSEQYSGYLYGKEIQFIYNNQSYGWLVSEDDKKNVAKDIIYKTVGGKKTSKEIEWKNILGFDLIAEIENTIG